MTDKLTCAYCGQLHNSDDTEYGAMRPDPYLSVPKWSRWFRTKADDDLCLIDGKRYFIRCTLPVPVHGRKDPYSWGLWAEIDPQSFAKYVQLYGDERQGSEPPFAGKLANTLPVYKDVIGLDVSVQMVSASQRPHLTILDTNHPFGAHQLNGMTASEFNEILQCLSHPELLIQRILSQQE